MIMNMTTLGEVRDRVESLSVGNYDLLCPVSELNFDSLDTLRIAGSDVHTLKPRAQQLICNRLSIPYQYLSRCEPDLQRENLEYWLAKEKQKTLFLRFNQDAEVRAIFTDRYRVVDNYNVIEQLERHGYSSSTPAQCVIDDEFMALSIPDGRNEFRIDGDIISPGISLGNSEVGLSSLTFSSFYLRLVCTNGMIGRTTKFESSYRHISSRVLDRFPEEITRLSKGIERHAQQFRFSVESRVSDPEQTIETFNRQFGVSESEGLAVKWGYSFEPGNRMYDLINGYTKGAQYPDLASAESRVKLQSVAGRILSMVSTN